MASSVKGENTLYSFDKVSVKINGKPVEGFWEGDDAVSVEDSADVTTSSTGAGGSVVTSVSTDQSGLIKIKVQHTSSGHSDLTTLHRNFKTGSGRLFDVAVNDIGTGEGVFATGCVLKTAPTRGLGQNASMREWTIFAAKSIPNQVNYVGL